MKYINTRQVTAVVLSLSIFATPVFAMAQTATSSSQMQAKIKSLTEQIEVLKKLIDKKNTVAGQVLCIPVSVVVAAGSGPVQAACLSTTTPPVGTPVASTTAGVKETKPLAVPNKRLPAPIKSNFPTQAPSGPQNVDGDTPPPVCTDIGSLEQNLSQGARGAAVLNLQKFLVSQGTVGLESDSITGYFGPKTLQAVKMFQQINNVTPQPTGFVGPLTRGFFKRICSLGGSTEPGVSPLPKNNPVTKPPVPVTKPPSPVGGAGTAAATTTDDVTEINPQNTYNPKAR